MITKCPYCDYKKTDIPVSTAILTVLNDPTLPIEDYILWIERLLKGTGLSEYRGVKVHIGRKHKGEHNWPGLELSPVEAKVFERSST